MKANIETLYRIFRDYPSICIDSRKVKEGDLFFAIKGEKFDGNRFAQKALDQGAAYAIIDNPAYYANDNYVLVDDVLDSLQRLANRYRQMFSIPFLAITGSNGKTTTKELINGVLSKKFKTHSTKGNFNNHIGVPLTLLAMKEDAEIAIIEMGANHVGEIAALCEIAEPTHGLITNIGKAHLEGFGGIEGVLQAKTELYHFIREKKGKVFIEHENELLQEHAREIEKIEYGIEKNNPYTQCRLVSTSPYVKLHWNKQERTIPIESQLIGSYNARNICAAICVGQHFGVAEKEVQQAIYNYIPVNNRSQVIQTAKNNKLILDAYNANPSSMKAALENFEQTEAEGRRKGVILGDMMELGDSSGEEHKKILKHLEGISPHTQLLVGKAFNSVCDRQHSCFASTEELIRHLEVKPLHDHLLLIKASRGMELEKITQYL